MIETGIYSWYPIHSFSQNRTTTDLMCSSSVVLLSLRHLFRHYCCYLGSIHRYCRQVVRLGILIKRQASNNLLLGLCFWTWFRPSMWWSQLTAMIIKRNRYSQCKFSLGSRRISDIALSNITDIMARKVQGCRSEGDAFRPWRGSSWLSAEGILARLWKHPAWVNYSQPMMTLCCK